MIHLTVGPHDGVEGFTQLSKGELVGNQFLAAVSLSLELNV
jgi:hypothetical protein